jgi:hypothetical protein
MSLLDNLKEIINKKTITPTIVNTDSNFVIVTYWWGNKIRNQNTSRPCISFFEALNRDILDVCVLVLGSSPTTNTTKKNLDIKIIYDNLEKSIVNLEAFKKIINKAANSYNEMIFDQLGFQYQVHRDQKAIEKLEKMKERDETPMTYEYKYKAEAADMFTRIMVEAITLTKKNILLIYDAYKKSNELKMRFLNQGELLTRAGESDIKKEIERLNKVLKEQKAEVKKILNTKQHYTSENMQEFDNMSIYEILHKEFRFLNPMTYDKMIEKWERECAKFKCNYMAVEYPEFTKPGGYQMAINAKPLFIQKALESCGERSVLYIDGDMFIRQYPKLFDLKDVDFMARGWVIDPRSSWKMDESITYDPYTFETSGGTMFFSQSIEAKQLINKWIEISGKSYQIGKADDRILSLVFNTYKFLCSMKIIQLPVEYLWLTLDYDDRMLDGIYDGDKYAMSNSIFIEHSECLTSEDTATGSGAASDRTPKFYGYLEANIEPVSELFHEYIMFPTPDMVDTFKSYLTYMSGVQYMNDGNPILVGKGFVDTANSANNEQPLYIVNYNDKYGNFKYPYADESEPLTYNDVAEINLGRVKNMNIKGLNLKMKGNRIEINDLSKLMKDEDASKYNHAKIISLIIKLLSKGKTVIYNPNTMVGYNDEFYALLLENEKTKYANMELIFVPEFTKGFTPSSNYFYKPKIQTNQPILFKPSQILIKFLMMFLSLDDLSSYINNGSYEFMSRIRVGYLIKKTVKGSNSVAIDASIMKTTKDDASRASTIDANYLSIGPNTKKLSTNMNYLPIGSKTSTPRGSKTLTPRGSKTLTPRGSKTLTPRGSKTLTPREDMTSVNMSAVNMTGGNNDINTLLTEYEAGIDAFYGEQMGGSKSYPIKLKRRTKKYRAKKRTFKRRSMKKKLNKTVKFTRR